jgi:DNA-binding NtrC family response regulator
MATQRLLFLTPAQAVTGIFPALRDAGFELGIAENLKGASASSASPDGHHLCPPCSAGFRVEDLLAVGAEDPTFPGHRGDGQRPPQEAERLLNLGARDYWLEPLDVARVKAAAGASRRPPAAAPAASTLGGRKPVCPQGSGPRIVGSHPSIRRVLQLARQVAPSRATVLITGESGTGKEMFARYLHAMSPRAARPFVAVNCAALPEHLLESELFGHEKGAFTGAIARKPGKFELADGGTLLLDEISEMDLALQAKLLRVLQEGEVDRVGGTEPLKVDVRVLATTNRNLEDWVAQGTFRQDLYFRLNVIPLRLPSLRERGDDVLDLARFFINLYTREYALPGTGPGPQRRGMAQKTTSSRKTWRTPEPHGARRAPGQRPPVEPRTFSSRTKTGPFFEDDRRAGTRAQAGSAAPDAAPAESAPRRAQSAPLPLVPSSPPRK